VVDEKGEQQPKMPTENMSLYTLSACPAQRPGFDYFSLSTLQFVWGFLRMMELAIWVVVETHLYPGSRPGSAAPQLSAAPGRQRRTKLKRKILLARQ